MCHIFNFLDGGEYNTFIHSAQSEGVFFLFLCPKNVYSSPQKIAFTNGIYDIDNPALITENIMILEIGKSVSKFYDYQHYRLDSVMIAEYNTTIFEENKKKYTQMIRNANKIQIYKNYPEGKITIIDRIPFDNYKYEEPLIYPKWELKNEKKTLYGYHCLKATTSFRG